MNRFSLLILFVLTGALNAQIQITQAHMPSIGDTIRYSVSGSNTLDFKQTGANYSWNYTTMNTTGQDVYKFQALLSTPYASLAFTGMPAGAIGYKVADSIGSGQAAFKNLYNFFEKKSTGWSAVGTGFTLSALPLPAGGVYKDKDEIYTFPLNYNDRDSTTFDVTTPLGNQFIQLGTFRQKGYRINKVEGWGTISTPYGNTINCLKIKSIVTEIDSLKVSTPSLNLGFQANRVEYRWLSTSEKIPVLEVTGTEIAGVFTPNSIRFRDHYRNVSSSPLGPKVKFDVNQSIGKAAIDSFKFINMTTPQFGNTYLWTITPSAGVRFVAGTTASSANPIVLFDSTGVYTVNLNASNFIGSKDSTAVNMITIGKNASNIASFYTKGGLIAFPNPVSKNLYFSQTHLIGKPCRFFDTEGRLVEESVIGQDLQISCEHLAPGIYTLVVSSGDTIYYTQITKE